jgi:hypothetical protein
MKEAKEDGTNNSNRAASNSEEEVDDANSLAVSAEKAVELTADVDA